jgi:rubredoxin
MTIPELRKILRERIVNCKNRFTTERNSDVYRNYGKHEAYQSTEDLVMQLDDPSANDFNRDDNKEWICPFCGDDNLECAAKTIGELGKTVEIGWKCPECAAKGISVFSMKLLEHKNVESSNTEKKEFEL